LVSAPRVLRKRPCPRAASPPQASCPAIPAVGCLAPFTHFPLSPLWRRGPACDPQSPRQFCPQEPVLATIPLQRQCFKAHSPLGRDAGASRTRLGRIRNWPPRCSRPPALGPLHHARRARLSVELVPGRAVSASHQGRKGPRVSASHHGTRACVAPIGPSGLWGQWSVGKRMARSFLAGAVDYCLVMAHYCSHPEVGAVGFSEGISCSERGEFPHLPS
jgi:hypothetical protein